MFHAAGAGFHHHRAGDPVAPPWVQGLMPPPPVPPYVAPLPPRPVVVPPPGPWRFPTPRPAMDQVRSLWLGEVQPEWTEETVRSILKDCGKTFAVKLMRDRATGATAGYGFIEFETHADAEYVLSRFADKLTLRWGHGGGAPLSNQGGASVFVGDLDYQVTEEQLRHAFASKFVSVNGAKLVVDAATGTSKGYGFVKFADPAERDKAMAEMNGLFLKGRPIRVTAATSRTDGAPPGAAAAAAAAGAYPTQGSRGTIISAQVKGTDEGENTCVFVGGLDESVTPDMLRHHFGLLGDIAYIRIPPGRGCGFVGFVHRKNAENAISTLQGLRINGYKVRLSWGSMRSSQNKKAAPAQQPTQQQRLVAPTLPVTQVKKEHKTRFGTLTNDFIDDLPDPKPPWERKKQKINNFPAPQAPSSKLIAAAVPTSPYVAQLKARYEAYRSAATRTTHDTQEPSQQQTRKRRPPGGGDDDAPGDCYSHYSTRTSRPAKRPLTSDEVRRENDAFANRFLATTLTLLSSGILLPLPPPPPLADHYDAFTDTPMAAYVGAQSKPPGPPAAHAAASGAGAAAPPLAGGTAVSSSQSNNNNSNHHGQQQVLPVRHTRQ